MVSPRFIPRAPTTFFDNVYNLIWLEGELEVSGFNYLATVSSKIPQTEEGMDGLKFAYRSALDRAVLNGFIAPGAWTSPTTFGNQDSFFRAIREVGHYTYSIPIASQAASDRNLREAALIEIAVKYAGAIHSSNVIININR